MPGCACSPWRASAQPPGAGQAARRGPLLRARQPLCDLRGGPSRGGLEGRGAGWRRPCGQAPCARGLRP
eukprot:9946749-Alexandrium_andersonii.AAC.1